ncbi:Transposable element tcb1 transposase [Caligus rogercresseyi]|uniref:Transposable element tcb1 transposase n=1 Tax=Caligus rogercresseyi TaxID=217165 RepID=A0A7T8QUH5_CALRO|nr:Transposable element tcb1 transposase [Caligus rogercresseyi]
MSSELERRTAIIVALRCGRAPKEIIDFFKFPKATVYSIAKSFKESEDIPYLYQQDGVPAHTSNLVQNWCLKNLDMFWSKDFWPPSSPDLNPATTTCGVSLRGTLTSLLTTLWTP